MNKNTISVFIIALNEADRIDLAIDSVKEWVQEIIVVDGGSDDDTVKVAKAHGATQVVYHAFKGYGQQKRYAEHLCSSDWMLNLDADEEVTEALRDEIMMLFSRNVLEAAYRIRIKDVLPYEDQPRLGAYSYNQIRLYQRKCASFNDSTVHDVVVVKHGKTQQLSKLMYHRSKRSYRFQVFKLNRYSDMQAEDYYKKGRKVSTIRLLLEPSLSFLKSYFFRRDFMLGIDGFINSLMYSFSRTIRLAKCREHYKREAYLASKKYQS